MTLALLLLSGALSRPIAQAATTDDPQARIKALEEENRRLREEADALRARLQAMGASPTPTPPPPAEPAGAREPGPEPWGNPNAAMRSLTSKIREELQSQGIAVPTADADPKAWRVYRLRAQKWIDAMAKFRQPIQWTIAVSEAVLVSSAPKEYAVRAHVLRPDGSRVEPSFTFRCPASAVPNMVPAKAAGQWLLKGELLPELRLQPETTSRGRANPFGDTPTIAPQMECTLRYIVQSMVPAATAPPPATPAAPSR